MLCVCVYGRRIVVDKHLALFFFPSLSGFFSFLMAMFGHTTREPNDALVITFSSYSGTLPWPAELERERDPSSSSSSSAGYRVINLRPVVNQHYTDPACFLLIVRTNASLSLSLSFSSVCYKGPPPLKFFFFFLVEEERAA